MSKKFKHRIEYGGVRFIYALNRLFPHRLAILFADCLALFGFYVIRMRRSVTLDNLRNAFGDKSEKELRKIAYSAYKQFSRMMFEYARFPYFTDKEIIKKVALENEHVLKESLERGKGAIIVSGHFGNWELMAAGIARHGYPVSLLVGEQKNKMVDDAMNNFRKEKGMGIIKMGVAARGVIKAVRDNNFVALLSDQDAGRLGTFVDFFGRKASTPGGTAAFALKTGADVIFSITLRIGKCNHKVILEKVEYDDIKDEGKTAIAELTQRYTSRLEHYVREYPDHYFWMHKRWKSKPE
ncbi:lysophospholipid acyltransferase family protein [candidate division KSB1 bacterium]